MRVHLCGVRGSTPAPGTELSRYGGHTSCLLLSARDSEPPTLILDAGTGLRAATEVIGERSFAGTMLLTHLHWDHIQGLPFFSAADRDDSEVAVLLPDQPDGRVRAGRAGRAMSPPHFPIAPDRAAR